MARVQKPLTSDDQRTHVGDFDEDEIHARLISMLSKPDYVIVGPEDDAAVVSAPDGRFVVNTAVLVEGRHFQRSWSSGFGVGWRAAILNLAHVASMGARPTTLLATLGLPNWLEISWVEECARGIIAACESVGATTIGGDLTFGSGFHITTTTHGSLDGLEPVLRSGASVGDVVAYAGVAGDAAAGLALLEAGLADPIEARQGIGEFAHVVMGYLRPHPPIREGAAAARAGATSMITVANGFITDGEVLAKSSNVDFQFNQFRPEGVYFRLLPAARRLVQAGALIALPDTATDEERADFLVREWVYETSGDNGLMATVPPRAELPPGFRSIGVVAERSQDSSHLWSETFGPLSGWRRLGKPLVPPKPGTIR
jgi:thiamine-monophosphate kinase